MKFIFLMLLCIASIAALSQKQMTRGVPPKPLTDTSYKKVKDTSYTKTDTIKCRFILYAIDQSGVPFLTWDDGFAVRKSLYDNGKVIALGLPDLYLDIRRQPYRDEDIYQVIYPPAK